MRRLIRIIMATIAIVAALPAVRAQLPDSPTGRRGNAIIAALRGGPDAITEEFFSENFADAYLADIPASERVEGLRKTIEGLGPIALEGANKTGPFSVKLIGTASTGGQRVEILYDIEEQEPHRITRLDFELSEAMSPMTVEEMVDSVDEYLRRLAADDAFAGVALIARGDQVLFERAYGLANRRYEVPNRVDTAFNLGSINKIFTKVALAQLAAAGKLSLEDTVALHLPDYPNKEVAERITIQQLATHTAGLGDIFTEEFSRASKRRFTAPEDYFALFADDDLLFEPGESESYSNAGYMVLGAIIEAVTGTTYHDYVRDNIFEPAGMTATHPFALDDPMAPIATGYTRIGPDHEEAPLHENTFHIPYTGTPAGGGYATARDLLAFRSALVGRSLTDARHSTWLLTDELPAAAPPVLEGIGIGVAGGGPGVNATLEMDGEWTIIVLTNLDPPSAGEASSYLRRLKAAVERGAG